MEPTDKIQIDLYSGMKIDSIVHRSKPLDFEREYDAVYVSFGEKLQKGDIEEIKVYFGGRPLDFDPLTPMFASFLWFTDDNGNPWIQAICQGYGASGWWPNKDHQSDEVDSMLISIAVPKDLDEVSNGRLRNIVDLKDGYRQHNWFVSNPINNYNVTFYIGKYAHWTDTYAGENGPLTIDYWSLKEDSAKARPHWDADVKPMLKSFEYWFGPYPWYRDGYKLVQAPHLGMEHQSSVTYGNGYQNGYRGRDLSGTGWGLKFDFIIIHESGHEWFANNITYKDIADMWIHESFTNYSESLFVEYYYGKEAGAAYVRGTRKNIQNDKPIIGQYDVNNEGSGDMYYKGGNMLQTIRQIINDDEKWRQILRGLNSTFYHQTVTTQQIENYISEQAGIDLTPVFNQYLRDTRVPTLEYYFKEKQLVYRWINCLDGFTMPVQVDLNGESLRIQPTIEWKVQTLATTNSKLTIDANYYVAGLNSSN